MSYEYEKNYWSGKDECCCNCDQRKHEDYEKEFLGKSVTECKFFRVCKCKFFEADKKHDHCGQHCGPKFCQKCQYCGKYHD